MAPCLPREAMLSLGVAGFYALCSVTLSMLNKLILSGYQFDCFLILLTCQFVFTLIVCHVSKDFLAGNPLGIPNVDWALVRKALPMGVMGITNVAIGLLALQMVNVPMFFCLRRMVSSIVLVYEFVVLGKRAERDIVFAVTIIVSGAVIAGWDSLSTDMLGYSITMVNNVLTAASSVMQKQFSDSTKLSALGVVYMNALIGAPLAAVMCLVTGDVPRLLAFPFLESYGFWFGFIVSCMMGLVLTYSSILCTTYNSPLATSVTGNAKDVVTTLMGWFVFSGFVATVKSVGGICISFMGAFLYSYFSLQRHRANAAAKALEKGKALPSSASSSQLASQDGGHGSGSSNSSSTSLSISGVMVGSSSSSLEGDEDPGASASGSYSGNTGSGAVSSRSGIGGGGGGGSTLIPVTPMMSLSLSARADNAGK